MESTASIFETLAFKNKKIATKNEDQIKSYFGERLVNSEILSGRDERGNYGYQIKYILNS